MSQVGSTPIRSRQICVKAMTTKVRTIRVHKLWGVGGLHEIVELDTAEASALVANCLKWHCPVFNTRTDKPINEITPDVEEISVVMMLLGGG
ncbi:MAG: hypothetical protein Q8O16_06410 [Dehalococcoidia bacterium]|nr:hypothetical protein [Dehalococcoidia bacterium]